MKSIYLLASAGAFALLLSGCAPELDQTGLSPEEKAWAENIKANYGAWQVPESVPRGVRRDDLANEQGNAAASALVPPENMPVAGDPAVAPVDPVAADTQAATAADNAASAVPVAVAPAAAEPEVYTVAKGDTLGGIARKYYGKASAWKRILDANSALLKGKTLIRPGMKLQIPRP